MDVGEGTLSIGGEPGRPLRVAAIGSDGPHHRHLYSALGRRFELVGVIVEQGDRWGLGLLRKRRYVDWFYLRVHERRQRLLGHRRYRRGFFAALGPDLPPATVVRARSVNDPEVPAALTAWAPDITIVFAVSILRADVLAAAGTSINVHAGCLPTYRGNQGIFMALHRRDEANVGASLHLVVPKVDAGPLLAVIHAPVHPDDNEETLWCRSIQRAICELTDLLARLEAGDSIPYRAQPSGAPAIRNRDRGFTTDLISAWRRLRGHRLRARPHWIIEHGDCTRTTTAE
ncbi:formyltransferase family protein [Nonomuraea sp. CA-141351]|uniref:formyltransferase family protein n=1 Tax=Nonomuraea sp. CA-141351 TaxID=3239996 RepID=UPI003D8BC422